MSRRAWALFAIVSLLWGMPYLFVKIALEDGLSPGFIAWSRVALAVAVLLPLAWRTGALRGLSRHRGAVVVFALTEIALPWPLIAAGQEYISSSLTAILIAALPLLATLVALRFDPAERPTGARLAGMLTGMAGVVALLGLDAGGSPGELLGAGLVLLAVACYAITPLVVKHHLHGVDPLGPVAVALAIGVVLLAPVAALAPPHAAPSSGAVASLVVLGLACSAIALVCFYALIAEVGPSRATVFTYVNPAVAVVLGVLLLDERLGAGAIAGLVLILCGSWLATGGRSPARLATLRGAGGLPTWPRGVTRLIRGPAPSSWRRPAPEVRSVESPRPDTHRAWDKQ